ncbi:hypothetical protein [Enterococcus sp. CWB-B31]|uniref:hypothetical protein n=1 Tax=Enterococcus sp. CWB-B31 TaxID=2885159 RepID=UPI001E325ED2|nr:hypothetical protein [Enterococcus sp. CWB-B31]MCB5954271.1 hypothetical protein [Enterococcus sp. CWB-B31]
MIRDVDPSLDFTVINDLFFQVIEPYQDVRDVFVLISINFVNGSLEYGLLVSGDRNFSRHKFSSCEELAVFIKNEDTAPNI